jgi:DNA-binding transcriptional ArsR family regulator
MVERIDDDRLTAILKAASDPTRRKLLTILVQEGPQRVTDLASRFDMSLNAVSKHIRVLETAGLVSRKTEWREHLIAPEMAPIELIDTWFRELRSTWEMRLERFAELMTEEKNDDS